MFDGKFTGEYSVYAGNVVEPCWCCGARLRPEDSKLQMKLSNFINIKAGKSDNWKSQDGKKEIITIETSNGPLTLGMRYDW